MKVDTGISESNRKGVVQGLSHLLADTYTLYLKTQNFHWNVTGPNFHSLHLMFEQQYQELAGAVDLIAERIRALGSFAPASYTEFNQLKSIKEETTQLKAQDMVKQLLADNETVIRLARSLIEAAENAKDDGTVDLLTVRIETHEKAAWMLRTTAE